MRCLQCGKEVPLLKRLSGSEFCSEAHRREYQKEYSQLALGRLLQSNLAELQRQPLKAPPLRGAAPPAMVGPPAAANALNGSSATAEPKAATVRPSAAPARVQTVGPVTARAMPPVTPYKIPTAQTPVAIASKNDASQPATAKAAAVQKPAPAELRFAPVAAPEFAHAFAPLAPGKPRSQADLAAELPHSRVVPWDSGVEIADSIARPLERKLELREGSRTTPKIALDLRVVPPESLQTESRALTIAVTPAAPAEASLWIGPHCDFAGEVVSLSDFADAQFSKSGFEVPVVDAPGVEAPAGGGFAGFAIPPVAESDPLRSAAPAPAVQIPEPQRNPLPVNSAGIAPGKGKPFPVFGPAPVGAGIVQIPQPKGLPLRPLMVLQAPAAPAAMKSPDVSIKPSFQESETPPAALNLGLPELRMPDPAGARTSRMRPILAALGGAAVLGAGLFFFVGKPGDAGLKSPVRVLADGAVGSQWIANYAPDVQRQRRVLLLRSSINLQSYRLDFESSIRTKALGWVYRAQDPKNFYVSKIELQKPGVIPVYAVVHFAVINGVEQPRAETPLRVQVPMGAVYKIRFEAVGNRFATWVQDQPVEQWTDARLSYGGAGLYSEGAEQASLQGDFAVTPLVKEK